MFDVGWQELLVILVVALLVFGPQRMVELARTAGKALREFRKATTELSGSLADVLKEQPPRRDVSTTPTPPVEGVTAVPLPSTRLVPPPPPPSTPPDDYEAGEPSSPEPTGSAPEG